MSVSSANFTQLRAFLAVAESLSFSRAAGNLGITPSGLSQTIKALEKDLGARLFHRTTRSVSLTEAGESLQAKIAPAFADIGQALRQSRDAASRVAGTVRVISFRSAAERFITPRLAGFNARYPDVTIDLSVDDSLSDPIAGGFDLALRIGEVIEQDMIAMKLSDELRQIAVAAPEYLARHPAPATPRDLPGHACICWRWPDTAQPYKWEFFENGRWFQVRVTGPVIVNDREVAIRAALDGIGIAFCVEDTVKDHIAAGRLVPVLEEWSASFPGFFLCYERQRRMAPAVRAFLDTLLA
ncbi:LysR family transcriptional regulator [Salinicola sp. CPA57]|uniref:LysR family transcriptional regulator n=1 Tax=Salinicola sp. CPA57 TaxID=1949080 RepID=UPI000DA1C117|nr:LysR family transcriptional regulator [Salinicola sp. CPA57]